MGFLDGFSMEKLIDNLIRDRSGFVSLARAHGGVRKGPKNPFWPKRGSEPSGKWAVWGIGV